MSSSLKCDKKRVHNFLRAKWGIKKIAEIIKLFTIYVNAE